MIISLGVDLKDKDLFEKFTSLKDNKDWKDVYIAYKKNEPLFNCIIDNLIEKYNFTHIEAMNSVIYEIFSINYSRINRKRFLFFSRIKWMFIYMFTLIVIFCSGVVDLIFTLIQTKERRDILYEEMWSHQSWYSRFYKYIDIELNKNKYKRSIFYVHPGVTKNFFNIIIDEWRGNLINRRYKSVLFDFKKTFFVFKNDFFYVFVLYSLSRDINLFFLYLRILKKMVTYASQVKKIEAQVLIMAGDYYWNPIKYMEYKKSIKNIILLQHNYKNEYLHNRMFQYCDYYYAHSQDAVNKLEGIDFAKKYAIGSFQLIPFLNNKFDIEYDILFLNQTVEDDLTNIYPNLDQDILRKSFYLLIDNLRIYLEKNKKSKVVYVAKGESINNKPSSIIKEKFKNFNNIVFEGVYGKSTFELVQKSKVIINMYSSVGFEAYGLDKRVLWINYNGCCSAFKYDTEKEDLHVMINDTSYEAFEERVNLLLSDNKEVDEHYKKLKEKYMNIQENPAKVVANKIEELILEK